MFVFIDLLCKLLFYLQINIAFLFSFFTSLFLVVVVVDFLGAFIFLPLFGEGLKLDYLVLQ